MRFTIEVGCPDTVIKSASFECDPADIHYYMQLHKLSWHDDLSLQSLLSSIEGNGADEGSLAERAVLALAEWFGGPAMFVEYVDEIAKRMVDVEIKLDDVSKVSREIMRKYPKST
jgi:hypothetical protein